MTGATVPQPSLVPVPGVQLRTKAELIADIAGALRRGAGFAAGKIGYSEQRWLYYPILLDGALSLRHRKAYELALKYHCERQVGIYPSDARSVLAFAAFHARHVANLDWLGLFGAPMEPAIVAHHRFAAKPIHYRDIEPDRSVPSDPARCYLDSLRGKRLLLLAPFADLLRQRATQADFEGTWSRIGKRWFHPAGVDAIEFPYGYDPETQRRFPTALHLFDHIVEQVERKPFDVALIAAGGLGIPLASRIKTLGRVAISLGGHLQVLFGVRGKRWREREFWQQNYFNAHWVAMPERYHPAAKDRVSDNGAYW